MKNHPAFKDAVGGSLNTELLRSTPARGIIGRVFKTGQFEYHVAREASPEWAAYSREILFGAEIPGLSEPSSVAVLPLAGGRMKLGVLAMLKMGDKAVFDEDEILFAKCVAGILASSIEKSILQQELNIKEASSGDDLRKIKVISTLAHEMRTPLTSIKGYSTALLMDEVTFKPETQREFLTIIDRECDILQGLISDFLESSAIEAGAFKINLQPVRIPRLATQAADEVAHRYPRHCIMVDFSPDFPLVDADPERITQVLRQLLDNAAKYSPEGGMIVLQGKLEGEKAVISVADEGVGISPEDLNHLFDRFFRVKSHSGNQIMGTGLGLPISKAIIEAHGGAIWAQSQLGQGSIFYFCLPLKAPGLVS